MARSYDFGYEMQKFGSARRALMLPHSEGEHQAIFHAFNAISQCIDEIPRELLNDNAQHWLGIVERTMETVGLDDPDREGTFVVRARQLTETELYEFSRAVDELASHFSMKCWDVLR